MVLFLIDLRDKVSDINGDLLPFQSLWQAALSNGDLGSVGGRRLAL
jgi:hypothetical protein